MGARRSTFVRIPPKGMERNIAGIVVIATFGGAYRMKEKLVLAVPPTASATVVDPHYHRRIDQVEEGDALILAFTHNRSKSWPYSLLFSRAASPKNILYHSRGMEATPPQKPVLCRPQPPPRESV